MIHEQTREQMLALAALYERAAEHARSRSRNDNRKSDDLGDYWFPERPGRSPWNCEE